jgi:hypothetical protein
MAKDLEYYLAQARRIEKHRDADFEKEIKKLYKDMLTDLRKTLSDAYTKWGTDDQLTFGMLQKVGYDARFLKEIQERVDLATKMEAAYLRKTVNQAYQVAYESMVDGVKKASAGAEALEDIFSDAIAITPEQIKAVVNNPVSGLTLSDRLEKHRKDIIYNIKQTVGVGLMNGDRYTTMAKRIAESLDGDYKKALRIARTETHRVREAGNIDAAVAVDEEMQNGTSEMRMVKTWRSMQDERVRPQQRRKTKKGWVTKMGKSPPNHMKMDGQVRLANELFDLGGGVTATAPGQSGNAGDDINCRCYASYEMMDDATYYAKTGKHFAITPEKKYLKQEKDLQSEQTTLEKERDAAQQEMQQLEQEQFSNIWKNPVTVKDYEQLKDRLDAKRDYFKANGRQDMIDLCDRFEENGKKYMSHKATFEAANKRLDAVADELKETRLKLMAARGIDPDKIKQEISDLQGQITKLQSAASGKKLSLQTKVKNYDEEQLKKAIKEAGGPSYKGYDEEDFEKLFYISEDDTIKEFMDWNIAGAYQTGFKQKLKELAASPKDADDIIRLQKLLKDKEDELATIAQRYGLVDDKFSQKRKDAAYWFTGSDAKSRADKVLRPDTGTLWQAATQSERAAAWKYTSGSGSFNRPLRGYDGSWYNFKGVGNVPLDREGSGDAIKQLTNLINRNPSKFDIWLQRGVESSEGAASFLGIAEKFLNGTEDELKKLLLGKVVKDEAFTSTAGAKGSGFSGRMIMNIFAPKGTKYIYAEPFSAYGNGDGKHWDGISKQHSFGYEFEVLLQRGTSFKITKVEKSGYTIYIDVDIVGQP